MKIDEESVARDPSDQEGKRLLANNRGDLGDLLLENGRNQEAETCFKLNLEYAERLVADHPEVPFNKLLLSHNLEKWGGVLESMHRNKEAEAFWRRSLVQLEKLAADYPGEPDYRRRLAGALVNIWNRGGWGPDLEGEKPLRRALEIGEKLVADFPEDPGSKSRMGTICNNLGNVCSAQGRFGEAERLYRQGIDFLEKPCPRRRRTSNAGLIWPSNSKISVICCGIPANSRKRSKPIAAISLSMSN